MKNLAKVFILILFVLLVIPDSSEASYIWGTESQNYSLTRFRVVNLNANETVYYKISLNFDIKNYTQKLEFLMYPVYPESTFSFKNFTVNAVYINGTLKHDIGVQHHYFGGNKSGVIDIEVDDVPKSGLTIDIEYTGNTTSCDTYKKCKFADITWVASQNEDMTFSKEVILPKDYELDNYFGGIQTFYEGVWQISFETGHRYVETIPYKKIGFEIDLALNQFLISLKISIIALGLSMFLWGTDKILSLVVKNRIKNIVIIVLGIFYTIMGIYLIFLMP